MQGGPGKFVYVILIILLLIDIYAFSGIRHLTENWSNLLKLVFSIIYWIIPMFIVIMTFYIMLKMPEMSSGKIYYRTFYTFMGVMILFYVPKLIFCAFELGNDIVNSMAFLINKFNSSLQLPNIQAFRYAGAITSILLFLFTIYGIIYGRYHYKTNNIELGFSNLPESFNGLKIAHISDWHIGSYFGKPKRIVEAVNRINSLKPDLILFTGDLVNNVASEVDEFIPALKKLHAKYGKYSILGNHDYGEYVRWESESEIVSNLNSLIKKHKEIGFNILLNETVNIEIEGQSIGLIGIENWGLPPFPQYGDLKKALSDIPQMPFRILLSHDPSHWDAEVKQKTNIDLTLSGHTHGMQFGIYSKKMKWSPVKYKYPKWAGLYSEGNQHLFVSVGIGYIGFPGRVGIKPEIALLKLFKKN